MVGIARSSSVLALMALAAACGSGPSGSDGGSEDGSVADRMCEAVDPEPNDTEDSAVELPTEPPHGCDFTGTFEGVVDGSEDVDFHRVRGVDNCADTRGTRLFFPGSATALRFCFYGRCAIGGAVTNCPDGMRASSPEGYPGCCTQEADSLTLELDCGSGSTLVDYYLEVRQPSSEACFPYEAQFRYF